MDPKARPAKLLELSSQGTETSPKSARLGVQQSTMTSFAINDRTLYEVWLVEVRIGLGWMWGCLIRVCTQHEGLMCNLDHG